MGVLLIRAMDAGYIQDSGIELAYQPDILFHV